MAYPEGPLRNGKGDMAIDTEVALENGKVVLEKGR
jgi:hypothetical protein